jgi:hypothetical protein
MNPIEMLKALLPVPLKRGLRALHRDYCLRSSIAVARVRLQRSEPLPEALLQRMIYGWSNEGWSAKIDLLQALVNERYDARTSILECGTGLSTILFSMISAQTGASYMSLEHDQEWYRLICRRLSELRLSNKGVKLAPFKSYGEFDWYDTSSFLTDYDRFDLVLCDGPPGSTRGGRYGLLPTMFGHICSGARIIVDDTSRIDELNMIQKWMEDFRGKLELSSQQSRFAILTVR